MNIDKSNRSINVKGNFSGTATTGDNSPVTYNTDAQQKQTLAEAAAEIQQLLEQLEKTYPTSTKKDKITVVAEAVDRIENNSSLKARIINALKAGGTEALKEAIDHPLANILMATIDGWQKAE